MNETRFVTLGIIWGMLAVAIPSLGHGASVETASLSNASQLIHARNLESQESIPCHQYLNERVKSAFGWAFIVRSVDAKRGRLIVRIAFRNVHAATGLIALFPNFNEHTRLIDETLGQQYPVDEIHGIASALQPIERDQNGEASFSFLIPVQAKEVRFTSTWVTAVMGGAGQRIEVEFPIAVPAPEHCGA
jgi:hypothetical protein